MGLIVIVLSQAGYLVLEENKEPVVEGFATSLRGVKSSFPISLYFFFLLTVNIID